MLNCFRSSRGNSIDLDDDRPRPVLHTKKSLRIRRQASGGSTISAVSTTSNASIGQLPRCSRASDPKIEAMMMPMPHDARPSRCLRISHPRIYGNLVADMKACKGCRDWRNFPVFGADDVDMNMSADEYARKKAIEYQRRVFTLGDSFDSVSPSASPTSAMSDRSVSVDMIG